MKTIFLVFITVLAIFALPVFFLAFASYIDWVSSKFEDIRRKERARRIAKMLEKR